VLSPNLATLRLFLHVVAASVWVGGQIVLVGVVPSLRASYPEATRLVAKAYGRVAWPAFGIAVVTGIWNMLEVEADGWTAYQITLGVKIMLVTVSGIAAAVHQVGRSKVALAVGGGLGFLSALAAMYVGLLLTTGT
jgi:putative copper export protein